MFKQRERETERERERDRDTNTERETCMQSCRTKTQVRTGGLAVQERIS